MKLHNELNNQECIGKEMCACIGENDPWVTYSDGNYGEKNYYKDVFVNGYCVYMDGEVCKIIGYDELAREVTMYCEYSDAHSTDDSYNGVYTIPYSQYVADFGLDWGY